VLCDNIGRKKAILLTDLIFILGAVILLFAHNIFTVLVGRVVVGVAVSLSGIADVSYLHEISPVEWRGAIVSCNEACISLGFFISYLAGYYISLNYPENGWRIMFFLSSVIALIQFIGMLFMPESPVWLKEKEKGRDQEENVYIPENPVRLNNKIRNQEEDASNSTNYQNAAPAVSENPELYQQDSFGEFAKTESSMMRKKSKITLKNLGFQSKITIRAFFSQISLYYRQTIIAVFLSVIQQFCGHPNVLNFAPEIFSQLGFISDEASLGSTLLLGAFKFIVTCLIIWKIEYLGRRFLLILGMIVISISLLFLTVAFASNNMDEMSAANRYIALAGVFGVAIGYAGSFGPLTWLLVSELFPAVIRGRALGFSTIITYLSASIVSYTFLSGQVMFGSYVPFAVYFTLNTVSIFFVIVAVPDTGGKNPLEIENEMKTMRWWRKEKKNELLGNVSSNHGRIT